MERLITAGAPTASMPSGISVSGRTIAPAAMRQRAPITAPSRMSAPLAMRACSPMVAPWTTQSVGEGGLAADQRRLVCAAVDGRAVLDVGTFADHRVASVTADGGVVPDGCAGLDADVADDRWR